MTERFTPYVRNRIGGLHREAPQQSLYLLRHPWEHWIKVGIAANIQRRMETYIHAWGCLPPIPPTVVTALAFQEMGIYAGRIEQFIKVRFEEHRLINREWLKLVPEVVELEEIAAQRPWDLPRFLNMPRR